MATHAEGVRRRRECKEAGRRQAILRLRSYEDSCRSDVQTMVQREADSVVREVMGGAVSESSNQTALQEARVAARIIDPLLNVMEEEEGGPDDYQDV
ncbi:conserved hypothetical protein, partial [Perkinsus marinus ATCC 50983]